MLSARDALDARIYKLDFRTSEAYSTSSAARPHTSRPASRRFEVGPCEEPRSFPRRNSFRVSIRTRKLYLYAPSVRGVDSG